eukprot:365745-Chlamydomonas_euryale.AAC.5
MPHSLPSSIGAEAIHTFAALCTPFLRTCTPHNPHYCPTASDRHARGRRRHVELGVAGTSLDSVPEQRA